MNNPFATQHKTYASSVTTKLLDDYTNMLPGVIVSTVITGNSLGSAISDYYTDGIYQKAMAYYRYGKGSFIRGLPEGYIRNSNVNLKKIKEIIEADVDGDIEIIYGVFDDDFIEHYIKTYLQNERNRNYASGIIGVNPTGLTGTIWYNSYSLDKLTNELTIFYSDINDVIIGSEVLPFNFKDNMAYQVLYRFLNKDLTVAETRLPVYWLFIENSEDTLVPLIDEKPRVKLEDSYYFPIIPFFENKEEVGSDINKANQTELYVTGRQCLKKLGLNFDDISQNIKDGTEENIGKNKGIYAYFQLSALATAGAKYQPDSGFPTTFLETTVELTTNQRVELFNDAKKHQGTLNYLFDFFFQESFNSKYSKKDFINGVTNGISKKHLPFNAVLISDVSYNLTLKYYFITFKEMEGIITDVPGTITSNVYESNYDLSTIENIGNYDSSTLVLRKEVAGGTYIELAVCGLTQEFNVFNNTSSIVKLKDAFKSEDPVFINIPFNMAIVEGIKPKHRNELIYSGMTIVVNSYAIQEIKWYQTGLFKTIINIVAIVCAWWSGGYSLTLRGLFQFVAYLIILAVIKHFIIVPLFKFIVEEIGFEAAAVIAVVLIAVGMGKNLPYAGDLIQTGMDLFKGIDAAYKEKMQDLQEDYKKLQSEMEILEKELERAKALLDNELVIDPLTMFTNRPSVQWGQGPTEFLVSKLSLPVLTLACVQAPSLYTELALKPPTTDESLKLN